MISLFSSSVITVGGFFSYFSFTEPRTILFNLLSLHFREKTSLGLMSNFKFSTEFPRESAENSVTIRDQRRSIYLSELTNEYWSMKHERQKKNPLKFSFCRCFGGVAESTVLRLYWFARFPSVELFPHASLRTHRTAHQCGVCALLEKVEHVGRCFFSRDEEKVRSLDPSWKMFRLGLASSGSWLEEREKWRRRWIKLCNDW